MAFVSDTFTDTAATALESHTGETGATWTKHPTYATSSAVITNANRARELSDTPDEPRYYASGTPASADYDVEAIVRRMNTDGVGGTGTRLFVIGRMSTSADTFYAVRYDGTGSNAFAVFKWVAGTPTSLGSYTFSGITNGVDYTFKLELRGTAIKAYIDGVERVSVTDSDIAAAGRAGIGWDRIGSDTEGMHADSFTASDPAAPAPGPALRFMRHPLRGI